jgi:hypothetical protein
MNKKKFTYGPRRRRRLLGLFYVSRRMPVYPSIVPLIGGHRFGGLVASRALVHPGLRDEYGAVVAVHRFHRLLWPAHTAGDVVHLQPKTTRMLITFERKKRTYFGLRTLHWQVTWQSPSHVVDS